MKVLNGVSQHEKDLMIQPGKRDYFICKRIQADEDLGSMRMSFSYGPRKPIDNKEIDDEFTKTVARIWQRYDTDHNGSIDVQEAEALFKDFLNIPKCEFA